MTPSRKRPIGCPLGYPQSHLLPAGAAGALGRYKDVADYRHQREEESERTRGNRCCIDNHSTSAAYRSSSPYENNRGIPMPGRSVTPGMPAFNKVGTQAPLIGWPSTERKGCHGGHWPIGSARYPRTLLRRNVRGMIPRNTGLHRAPGPGHGSTTERLCVLCTRAAYGLGTHRLRQPSGH